MLDPGLRAPARWPRWALGCKRAFAALDDEEPEAADIDMDVNVNHFSVSVCFFSLFRNIFSSASSFLPHLDI